VSITQNKYCCIVIGNPVYNNREWQLNDMIKKNASDVGLTSLKEIARMKYRLTMGKMKREFILFSRIRQVINNINSGPLTNLHTGY
jgi:hypothetical protein